VRGTVIPYDDMCQKEGADSDGFSGFTAYSVLFKPWWVESPRGGSASRWGFGQQPTAKMLLTEVYRQSEFLRKRECGRLTV
jgi:hypothetical protein